MIISKSVWSCRKNLSASFFEIYAGKIRCFYNKIGVSRDRLDVYDFTIAPGFHTPEWAKGAVMYQIFVDRFSSGDTNNTVEDCEYYYIGDYSRKVTDWRKNPSFMGVREFYGGDLQGVMNKLDYLQDLGVDVIYFNPILSHRPTINTISRIMITLIRTMERS